MQSIDSKKLSRIYGAGRGSVFTPGRFLDLGSRDAVDKVLSRLVQKGAIRRLARGLYDYPEHHPIMGILAPRPDAMPGLWPVNKVSASNPPGRMRPTGRVCLRRCPPGLSI